MTTAEQLRSEGRSEGLSKGLSVGYGEILLDLLAAKFGVVPDSVVSRVRSADKAVLQGWALRVMSADSLDDVFDE